MLRSLLTRSLPPLSPTRVAPRSSAANLAAAALAAAFFTLSPAAAQQAAVAKKTVVGFSQTGVKSAWRTAESASIQEEASKRGVELKLADAQGKQAGQISSIKYLINQKVDYIVLAPIVETGWDEVLKEAKKAEIPVILIDRGITVADDTLYTTLIAGDFVEQGRMAGEWLVKKTGGKAGIVELQGATGSPQTNDRQNGFMETIGHHKGMKVVKTQSADFTRSKGKDVMESLLRSAGDVITAVFAHNDDMALGAIRAIEEAGKQPGVDITVVSIDGIKAAFEAMAEGKLNATVECNPLLGSAVFDAIDKLKKGETIPKFIKQQGRLFEQATAKDELAKRRY